MERYTYDAYDQPVITVVKVMDVGSTTTGKIGIESGALGRHDQSIPARLDASVVHAARRRWLNDAWSVI